MGCHFLLQGIFPNQGSNLGLPHCGQIIYCLSHQRSPKWQLKVKVKVTQSGPTLCDSMDCIVHGIFQARILEWVAFSFSRGSSQPSDQPRDQTQVSRIAGRFFTSWATGKPKNTGVGSLSHLQWSFLTQESNWGLLHCRWILY